MMGPQRLLRDLPDPSPGVYSKHERKTVSFRRWLLWIPLVIFASLLYVFDIGGELQYNIPLPYNIAFDKPLLNVQSGFLVDTVGCRIPDLDLLDPVIREFIKKENPLNCHEKHPLLIDANLTSLFIKKSTLPIFNISDEELECCYQPFWRSKPRSENDNFDNRIVFADNCTSFKNEVSIEEEFVKVTCSVDNQIVYKNYHAFVPIKIKVEKFCKDARENTSSRNRERMSVLILGMDAVSRLNFHRQMPKTESLLRRMHAIELFGYNKVADNTFPNLVPVLSGLSEKELRDTCWPQTSSVFDKCNWIWKNFSAAGYRTAFGEDAAWMGLFTYVKHGFKEQPTDYYLRPFMKTAEDDAGHKNQLNANLCIGPKMSVAVLLDYISNFAIAMSSKDSFAFFWGASLTHDFLNYPSLGDDVHEKFLKHLVNTGSLNHTVFIFMSDHGIRWGGIRETYQGRLEERLPFAFFVFPNWFRNLYPTAIANLHKNTHRLTTPFDIYETLLDILNLEQIENESIRRRSRELNEAKSKPRQISLFLPVDKSRTCAEAGIDPHWCTCQRSKTLPVGDAIIKNMSLIIVDHLNSLLKPYGVCSQLKLVEVKSASVQYPQEHLYEKTKDQGLKDYVLVIRTTPGDALFEATVRRHINNSSTEVTGVVSRINAYGSQSSCVTDFHMKLYCFCKSYFGTRT
ncbi:uncharacterized protein LOC110828852 isoform X2 [Zootermopsis nevadensis]|uniref:uncharacterized protein LOC110828852 isoform X2 n=1 Tax=Zootermopsis nevadensis TaxID=136037 RepID=UPI000B8E4E90|nr:uncharacterized protein LOC110828852 isoform X2 [Zootermopsis nevadensis]